MFWTLFVISEPTRALFLQDKEGLPLTCRAVFIIGPDKKLKLSLNYPASVGRNMDGAQLTLEGFSHPVLL